MISPFSTTRSFLLTYGKPQWKKMLLLFLLLLGGMGLQSLGPLLLSTFLTDVSTGKALDVLIRTAFLFLLVSLLNQGVSVSEAYMANKLAWVATNAFRANMAQHCLQLDMDVHHRYTPGELIERIDGDVTRLREFFSRFIVSIVANGFFLIGVLIVLCTLDWRLGCVMGVYALLMLFVLLSLRRVGQSPWKAARQASADVSGFLEERLSGREEIHALGATPAVTSRFKFLLRQHLQKERRATAIVMLIWAVTTLLFAGLTILAFSLGAFLFQGNVLGIGVVYLLITYAQQLVQPIRQISQHLTDYQQAAASIKRVLELLQLQPQVEDGLGTDLARSAGSALSVEFQQVTFGYHEGEPILKDISFSLVPGQLLGIAGHTGSGKTTLVKLLTRLYDPQQGTIRLGDVDIRTQCLATLRQHIGIVSQQVQLFYATIRDNVTLFDASISDVAILAAFEALGLKTWIETLPEGLDTRLKAGGEGLSAGEQQLVALARVFLRQPGIVILDEAMSRLDLATEKLLERAMETLFQQCTGIIIAHRLSTLHRVDQLIILEQGQICEQGTRTVLQQDPSSYFSHLLRLGLEETFA